MVYVPLVCGPKTGHTQVFVLHMFCIFFSKANPDLKLINLSCLSMNMAVSAIDVE